MEIVGETVSICAICRPSPCDNRQAPPLAERLERLMPDLPSGTVTFLFTDIEGSTALWERDRRAMALLPHPPSYVPST